MPIFYMQWPRYYHDDRWPETEATQYYDTFDFGYYELVRKYHTDRLCMKYFISISFLLPDIDECLSGSHACNVTANCTNTDGSHNCTCKEGYTGDGQSCQGIISALELANRKKNYFLKNLEIWCLFLDINECSDGNHVCDVNSNCNNTEGSHICTCKEGYTGDGQSCQGE